MHLLYIVSSCNFYLPPPSLALFPTRNSKPYTRPSDIYTITKKQIKTLLQFSVLNLIKKIINVTVGYQFESRDIVDDIKYCADNLHLSQLLFRLSRLQLSNRIMRTIPLNYIILIDLDRRNLSLINRIVAYHGHNY